MQAILQSARVAKHPGRSFSAMYDAIVVGARCAGSPTAMLLARKGYRVLLVDRAAFPSNTISTHMIWQTGISRLKRWGLLDRLAASNCPLVSALTMDLGDFPLTGWGPPADGVSDSYGPRRIVLDKILVDGAVEAGVELRERFAMDKLDFDGDVVTGITGRDKGRSTITEKARIVIGADGKNSRVARTVGGPVYNAHPSLSCFYYTYWSGLDVKTFEGHWPDRRFILAVPTNDGLVMVTTGWPIDEFHEFRKDIEGNYMKTIDLAPRLSERVRSGRREERFVGTADLDNFFRRPYGPGWALVGDAGYHRDPITAYGISDAFRDAELLADAIDEGFFGARAFRGSAGRLRAQTQRGRYTPVRADRADRLVQAPLGRGVQAPRGAPGKPEGYGRLHRRRRRHGRPGRFFRRRKHPADNGGGRAPQPGDVTPGGPGRQSGPTPTGRAAPESPAAPALPPLCPGARCCSRTWATGCSSGIRPGKCTLRSRRAWPSRALG